MSVGKSISKSRRASIATTLYHKASKTKGFNDYKSLHSLDDNESDASVNSEWSDYFVVNPANHTEWQNTKGDRLNILFLFCLYVIQGVPLGLSSIIPLMLLERNVSYAKQALFSFTAWPFSAKILWAPIVDRVYVGYIGRRKSWLLPCQYVIGLMMIGLSIYLPDLMGSRQGNTGGARVGLLAIVFFFLNVSIATQDIAVDAWALTLLSHKNVGYQSTCNSTGQSAGVFIGSVLCIALASPTVCNVFRSVPRSTGFFTVSHNLLFWGVTFILVTTLILVFKKEAFAASNDIPVSLAHVYTQLWNIAQIDAMKDFIFMALTVKIGAAVTDVVTSLKLIEYGISMESLVLLTMPRILIQVLLPLFLARHTSGPNPLFLFLKAIPYRIGIGLWLSVVAFWSTIVAVDANNYPFWFYGVITLSFCLYQVPSTIMLVTSNGFIDQVTDLKIGGTYMTFMVVMLNLGSAWTQSFSLHLLQFITWKACNAAGVSNSCANAAQVQECQLANGKCVTYIDGYYIESVLFSIVGFVWLHFYSDLVVHLQCRPLSDWRVPNRMFLTDSVQ